MLSVHEEGSLYPRSDFEPLLRSSFHPLAAVRHLAAVLILIPDLLVFASLCILSVTNLGIPMPPPSGLNPYRTYP